MKRAVIVVGMPASGKGIAKLWAERNGVPYIATGDIVRAEARRRGLDMTPETMANLSDELRGEDGMGVTALALSGALNSNGKGVVMEGMRSMGEVGLIKGHMEVLVVAFVVAKRLRYERFMKRGREDDTGGNAEVLEGRDNRELAYGVGDVIALADKYVLNDGSMDEGLEGFDAAVRPFLIAGQKDE